MKNGRNGTYTLRATCPARSTVRFQLDNGDFNSGFKVIRMELYQIGGADVSDVILHTNDQDTAVTLVLPSFEDNRQIAWGSLADATRGYTSNIVIDPNHIIVNDLYFTNNDSGTGVEVMVILEKKEISDTENILYQIKERAQGPLQ